MIDFIFKPINTTMSLFRGFFHSSQPSYHLNVLLILCFLLSFDIINTRFDVTDLSQNNAVFFSFSIIVGFVSSPAVFDAKNSSEYSTNNSNGDRYKCD